MFGSNEAKEKQRQIEELQQQLAESRKSSSKVHARLASAERKLIVKENQIARLADELSRSETTRAAQEAETSRAQQSKIHAQRLSAAAELQNQEQRLAIADLKQALKRSQQDVRDLQDSLLNSSAADAALARLAAAQHEVLELIQGALTCPMCFDSIPKNQLVSLACGHSFCQTCIDAWAAASVTNQMRQEARNMSKPIAPECPECRGDASKRGRTKVYMLEDIVRAVQKFDQEEFDQSVLEVIRSVSAGNPESQTAVA